MARTDKEAYPPWGNLRSGSTGAGGLRPVASAVGVWLLHVGSESKQRARGANLAEPRRKSISMQGWQVACTQRQSPSSGRAMAV